MGAGAIKLQKGKIIKVDLCTTFQVFWYHKKALCDEQTEIYLRTRESDHEFELFWPVLSNGSRETIHRKDMTEKNDLFTKENLQQ